MGWDGMGKGIMCVIGYPGILSSWVLGLGVLGSFLVPSLRYHISVGSKAVGNFLP